MANESQLEVYRSHREAQDKYAYFLLAAAGAAIGLAVTQTQVASLGWSQSLLGVAVLSWAASFCSGCRHLALIQGSLYANMDALTVESGQHPKIGRNPQGIEIVSSEIRKAIESDSNKVGFFGRWQFRLLVAGAACYVGWHVWEMYLRTIAPPVP